jgi:pyroglutamyl-peptidase
MGQSRRLANRTANPAPGAKLKSEPENRVRSTRAKQPTRVQKRRATDGATPASSKARVIIVTGFAPFGGERTNPSWEVAARLDGRQFHDVTVKSIRLPVNCAAASRKVIDTVARLSPAAVVGLGQAGGRPALSFEKIAINLADPRANRERDGGLHDRPVIDGGPDAYFTRLPLAAIMRVLNRHNIPAGLSLSAGVYVCNAVMYATLHALRQRRRIPAGFIHLPYETAQAAHHRAAASMSLEIMTEGVSLTLESIAKGL